MVILKEAKTRTAADRKQLREAVEKIIDEVACNGVSALHKYSREFDRCNRQDFCVSKSEVEKAYEQVSADDLANIKAAATNIRVFAEKQRETLGDLKGFEPIEGVELGHNIIPVDSCLCYVPGGGYPLYSTALMLGIPAKCAGVKRVIACSPVVKGTNNIHSKTLVAMDVAGIDEIYGIGGAQAVAAFAYGVDGIDPVKLIVGPGNAYVTEAKRQCYGKVGIDFVAGPSEMLIIADESADPKIAAADMLAQAEHDKMAKSILITTSKSLGKAVIKEVEHQLKVLTTVEVAEESWRNYGEVIVMDSLRDIVDYSNEYAPEHLEIQVLPEREETVVPLLRNYGSLFIGQSTAEVFGDYASGTNHTLPTLGAAGYTGGVWVGTFLKTCTYQRFSDEGVKKLAPLVSNLARGEGLEGHAKAAEKRFAKLKR